MGLCESVRGWSWPGSAGTFRAGVGVLLLGLSLAQSVPPQPVCPAAAAPQSLTQPQYQDTAKVDAGVGFMAALVQSFLRTVQPNPLPKDLILKIVHDSNQVLLNQEIIKEVLVYEVGFLVCAAIGVLYIVLMPIVGFFLACCRCCGNCGGKMYQKQTTSIHCRRRTFYWTAFVTTVIILAGNICMFKSNEAIKVSVDQSQVELNQTIGNIQSFLTAVPQQVNNVVNESYRTVEEVTRNLDGKNRKTVNTSLQVDKLNSSLAQLQSSMDRIQANVTAVKNQINQTSSKPNCNSYNVLQAELQKLPVDTSITIPNFNEFQSAVDEVNKINLKSKIKKVEDYLDSILQSVTNDTKDVVQSSQQMLGEIKTQISQLTNDIPLSDLTKVSETLNQVQREIGRFTPAVERAEYIRWTVCVVLCCVVLLVVLCNLLGLVLGPLGLTPKADPTKRSCTSDCGGIFLIMGAGFSFLFSWLFMIGVLVLFLLGGNVYTLLCRPWSNGELLKLIDTPGLIPGLEIGPTLGLKTNINISDIYWDCEKNQPLWTTLHLYELINLGDLLNVSKYTEQIQQLFENKNITLPTITLLSPEVKKQLGNFSNRATNIDFTAVTQKMNNISSINLNTTADKIDVIAVIQVNNDIKKDLQNEARDLRQIQTDIETTIIPQLVSILKKFLDCQINYFIVYADWANITITQQVGRCGPVAGAVDSVEIILCSHIVESLNAFWFSLGWCMIFFIPSIIFSIKLAKYYRRMKYSDAYDDHLIMNHIPRAQMKFT
uniref:Prominin-1-A-like n=1 Tax=Sander lucioperca TaxID=283035 RepID=A0A8C9Y3W9_SANLU